MRGWVVDAESETITSGERLGVGEGSLGRRMLWRGECDDGVGGDECGAEMGSDEDARRDGYVVRRGDAVLT